jgi:hypothetical protein
MTNSSPPGLRDSLLYRREPLHRAVTWILAPRSHVAQRRELDADLAESLFDLVLQRVGLRHVAQLLEQLHTLALQLRDLPLHLLHRAIVAGSALTLAHDFLSC